MLQETKKRLQCWIQIPSQLIPLSLVVLLGASDSQIRSPLSISTGLSYRHLTLDLFKSSFHTQPISSVLSRGSQLGVVLDLTFPHLPLHSPFLLVLSTTTQDRAWVPPLQMAFPATTKPGLSVLLPRSGQDFPIFTYPTLVSFHWQPVIYIYLKILSNSGSNLSEASHCALNKAHMP